MLPTASAAVTEKWRAPRKDGRLKEPARTCFVRRRVPQAAVTNAGSFVQN